MQKTKRPTRERDESLDEPRVKVTDRRHWARADEEPSPGSDSGQTGGDETPTGDDSRYPTVVGEFRRRAEEAERKLHEYIAAYKQAQADQDEFRARLQRDVERRVQAGFAELVTDLLSTVDDLDLALSHVEDVPQARALAEGVSLARDGFLASLERRGVERIDPAGDAFDPHQAEAMRVDPVEDPAADGRVTQTLQPGFRLGDRVLRPARVAVGRLKG